MTDNFSLLPGLEDSFEPFYPGLDLSENKIANSETEKLEIVNPTHDVDNKTSEDPLDNISLAVLQANFEQRSRFKSNHSANSNTTQINSPPYTLPRQYAGESSSSAPSRSGTLGSRPTNKSISSSSSSESIKTLSEKLSDVPSMSTDTKSEEFAEGFKIEPMRPNADARKSSKKSKERERRPLPTNLTNALIRVSSSRSAPVLDTVSSNISTNDLVLTSQSDLDNDITMHTAYTMKRYEGGGVVLTDRLPGADSSGTEPVSVFVKGGYKVSDHFLQREDPEDTLRCNIIKEQRYFGIKMRKENLLVVRFGVIYLYGGNGKRCKQIDLKTTKILNISKKEHKVSIFTPFEGVLTLFMQKPELCSQLVDIICKFSTAIDSRPASPDIAGPQSAGVLNLEENDLTYENTTAKNSRRVKSVDLTRFKTVPGRSEKPGRKYWF